MFEVRIRQRGRFAEFLDGVRGLFRRKEREAAEEIGEVERPDSQTEAEEALHLAMGWESPQGESAGAVLREKTREVLGT